MRVLNRIMYLNVNWINTATDDDIYYQSVDKVIFPPKLHENLESYFNNAFSITYERFIDEIKRIIDVLK